MLYKLTFFYVTWSVNQLLNIYYMFDLLAWIKVLTASFHNMRRKFCWPFMLFFFFFFLIDNLIYLFLHYLWLLFSYLDNSLFCFSLIGLDYWNGHVDYTVWLLLSLKYFVQPVCVRPQTGVEAAAGRRCISATRGWPLAADEEDPAHCFWWDWCICM